MFTVTYYKQMKSCKHVVRQLPFDPLQSKWANAPEFAGPWSSCCWHLTQLSLCVQPHVVANVAFNKRDTASWNAEHITSCFPAVISQEREIRHRTFTTGSLITHWAAGYYHKKNIITDTLSREKVVQTYWGRSMCVPKAQWFCAIGFSHTGCSAQ